MSATVLVTGGAGFIGSHTCVELLDHGYDVVVVDDHSNSSPQALERVAAIAGRPVAATYEIDLRDRRALSRVFDTHAFDAVIHFAAKKAVGESVENPVEYYDTNVGGTTTLLSAMRTHDVNRLVFSSSCSIYGDAAKEPLTEQDPAGPTNPYATTKWLCEQVLADTCRHLPDMRVLALRYFNPVGAHPTGLLGEDPRGVPNNVMPYLAQIAIGRLRRLRVFGDDYPTADGTGVRDYIHVMDVAEGHRAALEHLGDANGMRTFNLGTGVGTSVLQLVAAFADACGREIPYEIVARRPGDVAALVADPSAVARAWSWATTRDLATMCRDAWRFQEQNPSGYPRLTHLESSEVLQTGAPACG
ncbi:UDP-glucose 4-epimerase GalE [Streptomyces agglomeratus]|uniref:UDP-glucose 4-epimerase n=1 Tax=Streptomyces agglomeratus TaxID=285458 RepID=A0A1E5PH77_9ACTN|nr:UDP-glucose 4-epimerase GalE [Streptomyces agglomeratus]OEJ22183.1 UDP-glucose 4-epimerase GalE [Streptomyces agglomeratus]OEJ28892.1 UDP-glucose 4-epimerase GalE [Streptomyces agglomeratus]OEJ37023.1 UDP-glucose 4-epimerase GalE [Streptomyces agglomeratus]OEJ48377.1 UDP-glucose 4-epimerase GalE [Streptomyces agglomeratus]OEJ49629.1 UDP-glucose 4-epimerase GalE [Streptomyces agglomeratus]